MEVIAIAALVALFLCGAPIYAVLLGFALLGSYATSRAGWMQDFSSNQLEKVIELGLGDEAEVLSIIPLFVFAGVVMAESKTADRLLALARAAIGWLPGGLAVVTVLACALFTTFTGASGVTIVALGGLVLPALLKERYPERFSLGLIAGTGSVGLLFPPALPLFIYGTVYGFMYQQVRKLDPGAPPWDTERFIFAGIVPGLLLVALLCLLAIAVALRHRVPRHAFDARELRRSLKAAWPEALLPVLIITGLATGLNIPEVASLTVVYVLVLELGFYRDLAARALPRIIRTSMALVGAIFIILFAAAALTNYFVTAQIPDRLVGFISATLTSKWSFLLALNILLLFVGMIMDIFSAIVVIVPLIYLPAYRFGVDPYHLGVIFLLNLEIGYLTPPVGLNLFITSFTFQKPVVEVTRSTLPFLAAMIAALGVVTYVPALTVVPEAARTGTIAALRRLADEAWAAAGGVQRLDLPDGTSLTVADCGAQDPQCQALFAEVTDCRNRPDPAEAAECERERIQDYAARSALTGGDVDDLLVDDADKEAPRPSP